LLAWREADDRQPGVAVAECRDRGVPPTRMLGAAFMAKRDQARAQRAIARRLGFWDRGKVGRLRHREDPYRSS
jgi:hypothetical protein